MQPQLVSAGVCTWCGARFTPRQRTQRFCSRRCAGRYQWRDHTPRLHTWGKRPPLDADHRKLRKQLLPAAIGRPCPLGCGWTMDSTAQLDHIIARALGGTTTRANCRIVCAPCNAKRGSRLGGKRAHARKRAGHPTHMAMQGGSATRSNHW